MEFQLELRASRKNYPNVPANPTILINLFHEDMPHATHLFLEQVAHRLWDGCAFTINAEHVFQANPTNAATKQNRIANFQAKELDILSFQEYSTDHQHEQYTLGFTGRPAGPGFYINKIDNSFINGPGGQSK